jgi:hypothetical protein
MRLPSAWNRSISLDRPLLTHQRNRQQTSQESLCGYKVDGKLIFVSAFVLPLPLEWFCGRKDYRLRLKTEAVSSFVLRCCATPCANGYGNMIWFY